MTRWLGLTVLAIGLFRSSAGADGPAENKPPEGWKAFQSKEGDYEVFIPSEIKRKGDRERNLTLNGQKTRIRMQYFQAGDGLTYTVVSTQYPPARVRKKKLEDILAMALDDAKKGVEGDFSEPKDVAVGPLKGREVLVTKDKGAVRERVFFARGRLYELLVAAPTKEAVMAKNADVFLDSLRVTAKATESAKKDVTPKKEEAPNNP